MITTTTKETPNFLKEIPLDPDKSLMRKVYAQFLISSN